MIAQAISLLFKPVTSLQLLIESKRLFLYWKNISPKYDQKKKVWVNRTIVSHRLICTRPNNQFALAIISMFICLMIMRDSWCLQAMPVRFAMGATSSKGIPISINAKKNASTPFLSSHHRSIIKCPYLNSDIIHYVIPGCFRNDSWRNLLFASPLTACHLSSNYYSGVIPFFLFSFFSLHRETHYRKFA